MTPSATSERAPMKQSSLDDDGFGLQRLQHAPMPTPPEMCTRLPIWAQEPTVDQVSIMVLSST